MSTCHRVVMFGLAMVLLCLPGGSTRAFIKVDLPMAGIYASSEDLYVAKVKAIEADKNRVIVSVTHVIRANRKNSSDAPPADPYAIQFDTAKELLREVTEGAPVVVFVGKQATAVHLADTWLLADRPAARVWRVHGQHNLTSSFPGRTGALVQVVNAFRNGKAVKGKSRDSLSAKQLNDLGNPLLDMFEHSNWGKHYPLGKVEGGRSHLISADVNGDKEADVLLVTPKGVRLYLGSGPKAAVTDATNEWKLNGVSAQGAAFGDSNADGKPDLLLDRLWLNEGSHFTEVRGAVRLPDSCATLAQALVDVTGDKHPDAIFLGKDGQLHVFENPVRVDQPWKALKVRSQWTRKDTPLAAHFGDFGDTGKLHAMVIWPNDIVRYPLHDDGGLPADFQRLTGQAKEARYLPIQDYLASAVIDLNGGDGRFDLVVATKKGKPKDICLMNRGYGAYWPNNESSLPRLNPVAMTSAYVHTDQRWELLIVTAAGELIRVDSPPYVRGKPVE